MNRPVKISFALNGFVAEVGCQTLVFNDLDELLGNLRSYLQDPEATETAMRKNALNTKITLGDQPQHAPAGCYAGDCTPPVGAYPSEGATPVRGQLVGRDFRG